jgi:hypothetical protein
MNPRLVGIPLCLSAASGSHMLQGHDGLKRGRSASLQAGGNVDSVKYKNTKYNFGVASIIQLF